MVCQTNTSLTSGAATAGTGEVVIASTSLGITSKDDGYIYVPSLDHFTFDTISSPQTAGTSFSITITAKDSNNNTVTSYTGTPTLSDTTGTISLTVTTAFTSGTWTGNVTITTAQSGVTITATDGAVSNSSNALDVG